MSSVTLESVSLAFPGGTLGLADVDLSVGDGEFVALVGPSGSGKTTLLRTVAGFAEPTGGTVRIGDTVVAGAGRAVEPERRGLGMVFQQHAVWPHWSVGKNIEYPLKRAGVSRSERRERVSEALTLVGLAGAEARNPATLSGGQRQRVAIARAIVARPRVLLLDEALSALDEPLRDRLRLELRELTRELGLTVIHVTHDRGEALALADRVVVLDGGRIQQQDTPAAVLARPATPFVARFIADATIVPGSLDSGGFTAAQHPLAVPAARLELLAGQRTSPGASAHSAELAILPEWVRVVPDPCGEAVVTSSLFGRDCDDLTVDWLGLRLRSRVAGSRVPAGTRVRVECDRTLVYAEGSSVPRAAHDQAAHRTPSAPSDLDTARADSVAA
ncbi:ABC transporter ATP-binding protein [Leucobacter sp. G161]|uniref:ABC transporter ATP-binding protein n=1 Tax=Leucobacter sp. G161 TaxID=663704 RepID=UPI00073CDBD8|nr:ABC transporter ATP-binding protein [Leucobacter sp. G161]KUF06433.1 ABC transporter ATP-binding protein [Leucobacter sp. G161]